MKLWRKYNRAERELPSFLKNGLTRFNRQLINLANFLQRTTNNYSVRKKKTLLLLFVIVFVTESSALIMQSLQRKDKTAITVHRIKTVTVETDKRNGSVITRQQFFKIQKFKKYIDSLTATAKGRKLKDSFLHTRPHLMDSVGLLINLYLKQSKMK